jgi:Fur family zinc uptake transcriptional regulator
MTAGQTTRSLTRNQALVFEALDRAMGPMSAYAILDHLRDHGLRAPLQIYRALDRLVELGLVHRLESINAFLACHDTKCCANKAVAFAICDDCGQVSEISNEELTGLLQTLADSSEFTVSKSAIELHGRCAPCSGKPHKPSSGQAASA